MSDGPTKRKTVAMTTRALTIFVLFIPSQAFAQSYSKAARADTAAATEIARQELVGTAVVVEGGVDLHVRTSTVSLSPTAKLVESVERVLRVRGDELSYELYMAAVGEPHQLHLTATLHRSG